LDGIDSLFPSFDDDLASVVGGAAASAALEPSVEYREVVYASPKLDLTNDLKSKFALTVWYAPDNPQQPELAELSFKYDTVDGKAPFKAARRALDLLRAIQDLPSADAAAPTKTALAGCAPTT
jgi:hypothetical protein